MWACYQYQFHGIKTVVASTKKGVTVTKQRYRQESKQNSKLWTNLPLDQEANVLWPSQPSTYAIL